MSAVWFTSDTHFGHKAVARYAPHSRGAFLIPRPEPEPPDVDVDAMDDALIANWNAVVGAKDDVYHLGDFSFRNTGRTNEIISRLRGRIHLVRGNHDDLAAHVEARFASVEYYRELKVDGRKVVLCHYPLYTWNRAHKGAWHLHGHSHGRLRAAPTTRLDVGVDTRALRPYAWDDVRAILQERTYGVVDHHGEGSDE